MSHSLLTSSIALAIISGTPVLFAATGELLVERVGVVNIGIEGLMLVGALVAFVVARSTHSVVLGLLAGAGGGIALAAVFAIPVVLARTSMIMVGFALWFLGVGLTDQLGGSHVLERGAPQIGSWNVPGLSHLPFVGPAIFQLPIVAYLGFLLPFAVHWLLTRTRHGLNMRAIGENPTTADALGVNVTFWRFFYVLVGGALAGIGGGFLALGIVNTWLQQVTAGQGWIALAVVIFARWNARATIAGAYLFGALQTMGNVAQAEGWSIPSELFSALPYIGTTVVLIAITWFAKRRVGWPAWPSALGEHFVRSGN